MGFKKKSSSNANRILSRKEQRKEKRKQKKEKRNDYYTNRRNNVKAGRFVMNPDRNTDDKTVKEPVKSVEFRAKNTQQVLTTEEIRRKEQKEQQRLKKDMQKQRSKQLMAANVEEDRDIKRIEKQLKLNKRKSKALPQSFSVDGLDYLLEVCDADNMKKAVAAEQQLNEVNDEFEEDFALMTGKTAKKTKSDKVFLKKHDLSDDELDDDSLDGLDDECSDDEDGSDEFVEEDEEESVEGEGDDDEDSFIDETVSVSKLDSKKRKRKDVEEASKVSEKSKKKKFNTISDNVEDEDDDGDLCSDEDDLESDAEDAEVIAKPADGTWEDIYGRLRAKDGSVINKTEGKYIPPAIRAKMESQLPEEKQRSEKLNRLRKQLKGLLNRLAESNLHNIATQIEDLYMKNSRNDMNETITNLVVESVMLPVISPERLLMEHVMLVAILHANVGTEVGAHFLQSIVKKFDLLYEENREVEDKTLVNVVNILAQLYNFKLFDSKLLYEILKKLSAKFEEKNVECILHILRTVGFGLRKDDPIALKNLIFDLQKQASDVPEATKDNSRVKFMLDILLAIKNNNVTKIPNYDTTYSEHLKKIMKNFVRKGNYVTQLNISLEDLLKADERGKWWVVGSAWTGNVIENIETKPVKTDGFSDKLLELARKQRMNTDTRRNIFCIIMSAEDYLDAFEKILRLSLKNQQEREIIHVILHCCLQEKEFNPYYAVLSQKFCEYDRRFQMTIKYSVWDKLKVLNDHSGSQLSNLAKLLTHLFVNKGLPISVLKIVQFSELDKVHLRFMRQILLGILLYKDQEICHEVFEKVSQSDKLKMFRESLRLFIHHFLLKNLNSEGIPQDQKSLLEGRVRAVEKILAKK